MPDSLSQIPSSIPDNAEDMSEMIDLLQAEKMRLFKDIEMQYRKMGDREQKISQREAEAALDSQLLFC